MTKNKFLKELKEALKGLKTPEKNNTLFYYGEMIDDRIENGESEELAVKNVGNVQEIASQILADAKEQNAVNPPINKTSLALIIVGSPLWIALLAVAFAIIVTIYCVIWVLAVSVWAISIACAVGGIFAIITGIVYIFRAPSLTLNFIGFGCVASSVAMFIFYPAIILTRFAIKLSIVIWRLIIKTFKSVI